MDIKNINDILGFLSDNWYNFTTRFSKREYKVHAFNNLQIRNFYKQKEISLDEGLDNNVGLLKICREFLQDKVSYKNEIIDVGTLHYIDFMEIFLFHKSVSVGASTELEYTCTGITKDNDGQLILDEDGIPLVCNNKIDFSFKGTDIQFNNVENSSYYNMLKIDNIKGSNISFAFYFKPYDLNNVIAFLESDIDRKVALLMDKMGVIVNDEETIIEFANPSEAEKVLDELIIEDINKFLIEFEKRPVAYWSHNAKCAKCGQDHELYIGEHEFEDFFI